MNRASFGVTEGMLVDLALYGHQGWVDWQLEPDLIDDSDLEARLVGFDWIGQSAEEMDNHPTKERSVIGHEAQAVRLLRATYSKRQLYERIVEFWTDHFNVYGAADETSLLKIVDDQDVIRAHALGKFRDLLHASAASPAMVAFLNNDTNIVGAAQENYAREVMELHTLGSDGPYTENDVRELARCFTGWNFWKPWDVTGQYGIFCFKAHEHDTDPKTVLGLNIPAGGGKGDADVVLDLLANHPKTIDYVTTKLARWLLGYAPPQRAIDAGKLAWIASGGDIKEIVRTLLSPPVFALAAPWRQPKFKRPTHWVISLFRATGVDLVDPRRTVWMIWSLGQPSFQWPAPNGYPDTEAAWCSLLLPRWRQSALFGGGSYWTSVLSMGDRRALLGGSPKSSWAQRLSQLLTGGTMEPRDVFLLQRYLDSFASATDQAVCEAFELAAATPSFGRY